ncbi:MAG: START domain-containing protein [Desulfatibacillaceae bacterium]
MLIWEKAGIRGYAESFPGTDVREFTGRGMVEAAMEVLGEVLRDVQAMPRWMPGVKTATVVEDIDRDHKVVHLFLPQPWPMADRDVVVRNGMDLDLDFARCTIRFEALSGHGVPRREKCVRMEQLAGHYLLEYMGLDRTLVTYSCKAHPGGKTPARVANVRMQWDPYDVISGLRKMVRDPVYESRAAESDERALVVRMTGDEEAVVRVLNNRLARLLGDEALAAELSRDSELVAEVLESGLTWCALRRQTAKAIRELFDARGGPWFARDRALHERVSLDRALLDRLLSDEELTERFLMRDGEPEQVIAERVAEYEGRKQS